MKKELERWINRLPFKDVGDIDFKIESIFFDHSVFWDSKSKIISFKVSFENAKNRNE